MGSVIVVAFLICAVLGLWCFSRTRLGLVGLLVAGMLGMATTPAAAGTERCSYGDAAAQWQAFYPIFLNVPRDTFIPPCQYRIWLDKWTFTFTEDDYFLGGNALGYDYQAAGITRDE